MTGDLNVWSGSTAAALPCERGSASPQKADHRASQIDRRWRASSGLRYSAPSFPSSASQRRQPAFEDTDDLAANIGRRDGSSIHKSTPTADFILGADDHLIGIAIHSDEALGLLDLPHKIIDGLGALSIDG